MEEPVYGEQAAKLGIVSMEKIHFKWGLQNN